MAEPAEQPEVLDTSVETFILALDLADDVLQKSPELLADALLSADVQSAVKHALEEFVKDRLNTAPTAITKKDAEALQNALKDAAIAGIKQSVTHEIKDSAKYRALDASLKKLTEALKKSPAGVWVDKHSKILYIVGAVAIVGGAAAMYVTRTGDAVTGMVFPIEGGKSIKFKPIGKLQLEAGLEKFGFTPSKRLIETRTFLKGTWNQVEVKLNLALTAADGDFTGRADGKVVIPVVKNMNLQIGGSLGSKMDYSLNATLNINVTGTIQLGIMAGYGTGVTAPQAIGGPPRPPAGSQPDNRPGGFVGLGISASF